MPEFDDMLGLTEREDFKKGLAAVVLCEGCGPAQVDPEGHCLGDCWGDYFTKEKHICRYCLFKDTPAERPGGCPFHVGFFRRWRRRLFS